MTNLDRIGAAFVEMSFRVKVGAAIVVIAGILGTTALVYATGGVRFAYLHFMYVPVVLAGLAFGVRGGVLAGIAGGLAVGPFMPIDTTTGEQQLAVNWLFRMSFFVLIGALVGAWAELLRRHLRQLQWLREHHEATGLLNLIGLAKQLDLLIGGSGNPPTLVVAIVQLDTFLEIQNTFGPTFGLKVLSQVVERTQVLLPNAALVALAQPDRIAAVLPADAAKQVTRQQILDAVREPYLVEGVPVHVEASVGVARYPTDGTSAEELLQKASIAMHWAHTSSSTISIYDIANDKTSRDNLVLLGALTEAITRGQLEAWHQGKLHLASGEITATEALLRWNHPQEGIVPPGRFIPQVEETMLVDQVTHTVIAAALADARRFREAGYPLRVAVNLSVRNLRDRTLLDDLDRQLQLNGLTPDDIELEITESAVMDDPDRCLRLIGTLRDRGFGVAIDDFGVGQSSLAYLKRLHVTALKIDQDFVKTLVTDPGNQEIVRAILALARSLHLKTIAEGVEDVGAIELLRDWGCDYGQGYAIHRPSRAADLLKVLNTRQPVANAPALRTAPGPA